MPRHPGSLPDLGALSHQGEHRLYNAVAKTRVTVRAQPRGPSPERHAASERVREAIAGLGVWCSVEVDSGPLAALHECARHHARRAGVTVQVSHVGPGRWRLLRTD